MLDRAHNAKWWTQSLIWPVAVAAVIRLVLLIVVYVRTGVSTIVFTDTMSYLIPGQNLLFHGSFSADGVPDLLRTPGYSLFLAVSSLLGLPFAALVNVLVSVFTVILVWRLARTASGNSRIALCAAWIFAVEPVGILNSVVLMSETLFMAILLLSLERIAAFLRERRLSLLVAAGLWLTVATFVRPITYYLPVVLALGIFVVCVRIPGLRWKAPAVLLLSVLPWLAAWQIRNKVETGYGGFTSISDINLYFNEASDITARLEHRPWMQVRLGLGYTGFTPSSRGQVYLYQPYLAAHPEQAGWSQLQRIDFLHAQALKIIRSHPRTYVQAVVAALFKEGFEPGTGFLDYLLRPGLGKEISGLILHQGLVRGTIALIKISPWAVFEKFALGLAMLCLYTLAARGILRKALPPSQWVLLLGVILYLYLIPAMASGPVADSHYRVVLLPLVCIFAGVGLWRAETNPQ